MTSEGEAKVPDRIEKRRRRKENKDHRWFVGPRSQYDFMGATQFRLLTTLGLREEHYLLDIGCGSLRAGRLLIPYLLPDRYHGLEPNKFLIDEAIAKEIGADLIKLKRPCFAHNADFDFSVFGRTFDFIVAQSIFSHTGIDLAGHGLSRLKAVMNQKTTALVTFKPAAMGQPSSDATGWVYRGTVPLDEATIAGLVEQAGLFATKLAWFHPRQAWYFLATDKTHLPTHNELACLSGTVLRDERFADQQTIGSPRTDNGSASSIPGDKEEKTDTAAGASVRRARS